jgi:peptidoglycan-associated lipoprotein
MLSTSTTQPGTLVITLPSDALFGTQSNLQAGAEAILNSIVADLRTYPGASIRVAAYTDPQTDAAGDRTRSFAQAQAVKQYLSGVLGNDNFHWVAIGYGNRNPIAANDSPANRQRNRRVEITIDPP